MLNPISSATQPHAAAQAKTAPTPVNQSNSQPSVARTDTVQISAAAKAAQETIETPAQTAREAAGGDTQAKHLLAKEAAAKTQG